MAHRFTPYALKGSPMSDLASPYVWNPAKDAAANVRALRSANKSGGWVAVSGPGWSAKVWIERGNPRMSCQRLTFGALREGSPCDMSVSAFVAWMAEALRQGAAYPGDLSHCNPKPL